MKTPEFEGRIVGIFVINLILQKKLVGETDLVQVKENLSSRLTALQLAIDEPHQEGGKPIHPRMPLRQSLFLIFRPLSWRGALLVVLFYLNLAFLAFFTIGATAILTEKPALKPQVSTDSDPGIGFDIASLVVFFAILLGLRYLALHTYKKDKAKRT